MNTQKNYPNFKAKIDKIQRLPTLPSIAKQLLDLQKDPDATVHQLANIIQLDPILTSQILKYSNSAFFSSAKPINSILNAISLIGFVNSLNFSIGLTTAKKFAIPLDGPIGMRAHWTHALYSAHLMQILASKMPQDNRPQLGLIYLAGLLHNFGLVLLGHSFPDEFNSINQILKSNKSSVLQIEKKLLGISHCEIGVWLMRKWRLPKEIMVSVFEHHNEHYRGVHHSYANLTLLSDRLLSKFGIGDAEELECPEKMLFDLTLNYDIATNCTDILMENKDKIDSVVENILN